MQLPLSMGLIPVFRLPRCFRSTFRAPSPVQCYSASCWEPTPDMRTSGSPLQEQSKDTKDAYLFSRTLFLSQTCLHFAVSLFKNPVSCSLVASIFSGLHLAPHQHCQISTRVFVLGEPSQSLQVSGSLLLENGWALPGKRRDLL